MNILTLLTWTSVREKTKERKFLKFYSLKNFEAGEMIEVIDGNKKRPAIVLKIENAKELKQEIRKGEIEMKKLKLSKTGEFANGKIIDKFEISEIKKYLKNPEKAQKSENVNLKNFFPRKKKRILAKLKSAPTPKGQSEVSEILSFEKIISRPKTYNSEMQELVDEIRKYFNEIAVRGNGSFSQYIGFFKRIPLAEVRQMFGEVKLARNKTNFEKKKLFWWKIGQYLKNRKK